MGKCLHRLERTNYRSVSIDNNLNALNDDSPTRIANNSETAIDLSLCSPSLSLNFDWSVFQSPLDSNHCSIIIETQDRPSDPPLPFTSWNLKQADWLKFSSATAWQYLPVVDVNNIYLISDLYERFTLACEESILKCIASKFYSRPWWSDEVKASKQRREIFYQTYRRTQPIADIIRWTQARAEHKSKIRTAKQTIWRNYVSVLKYGGLVWCLIRFG